MNTIIIIGLLLLGGGVAIYKFKSSPKASAKKPAKKEKEISLKKMTLSSKRIQTEIL